MNIWIISDTHFDHENIKKYEGRPDNFNELIIKNWNDRVAENDLVIHLGDVIFRKKDETNEDRGNHLRKYLSQLKGKKMLTRGNHDHFDPAWYIDKGFDSVVDYFILNDLAFSHAPITPLPPQTHANDHRLVRLNIHGHFHRGKHRSPDNNPNYVDGYYNYQYWRANQDKYKLVQIEDELRPFLLEEILK